MIYISKILGWGLFFIILTLACAYTVLKKQKKNFIGKKYFVFFVKHHKLVGVLSIIFMILHGKFAMQRPDIFAILCLVFAVFLLLSHAILKNNKKLFRIVHLFLTFILLSVMILHIIYALL